MEKEPLSTKEMLGELEKKQKALEQRLAELGGSIAKLGSAKDGADSEKKAATIVSQEKDADTLVSQAEEAARWNEHAKSVLAKHPEVRPYIELRQAWQEICQRVRLTNTADGSLENEEKAARARMVAAYEALPLEMKAMLVM